jgi:hypothetical protein
VTGRHEAARGVVYYLSIASAILIMFIVPLGVLASLGFGIYAMVSYHPSHAASVRLDAATVLLWATAFGVQWLNTKRRKYRKSVLSCNALALLSTVLVFVEDVRPSWHWLTVVRYCGAAICCVILIKLVRDFRRFFADSSSVPGSSG